MMLMNQTEGKEPVQWIFTLAKKVLFPNQTFPKHSILDVEMLKHPISWMCVENELKIVKYRVLQH